MTGTTVILGGFMSIVPLSRQTICKKIVNVIQFRNPTGYIPFINRKPANLKSGMN